MEEDESESLKASGGWQSWVNEVKIGFRGF